MDTALDMTVDYIVSPVLVSAYDIRHHAVDLNRFRVPLIIVDSGGYEKLVDEEGQRRGGNPDYAAFDWSPELYTETLGGIEIDVPVIAVSYDRTSLPIERQIEAALDARPPGFGSAFLLKPMDKEPLTIESVAKHVPRLDSFDIIGITEKEAGSSLIERLMFIARLRTLLDEHGVDKPVHVFGALDPFMTPLYFLAGADIVDGLTWLRFEFSDDGARYLQSRAAFADPTATIKDAEWQIRRANYVRAVDMQIAFRRYLRSGRYADLSKSTDLVEAITKIHGTLRSVSHPTR
ncbi:hypothetical protein [Methylobacterium sp. Leaf87]|uniref:hypothetical protein n=1 Tax=Methylobacterium sp. Leaf87 TaxID=1736243 RepID=UPI0012E777B7|nr:hypothetical protein [Methylobacterium sp. Leaf87]